MFKKFHKTIFTIAIVSLLAGFSSAIFADSYCGDGMQDEGEECDDGNFINRDGCDSYCKVEEFIPPEVISVSVGDKATGISMLLKEITIVFSEPIREENVNENSFKLRQAGEPLDTSVELLSDQKTVVMSIHQDLVPEAIHAINIENVRDLEGNLMAKTFVSTFETGEFIDIKAPTVVAYPEGGTYTQTQLFELKAYVGEYTGSDEYLDTGAVIHYTTDGSEPTLDSPVFEKAYTIDKNMTIKYFAIDEVGNQSEVKSATYKFTCPDYSNATKISPYPLCRIQDCEYGYILQGNICLSRLNQMDSDDYRLNAVTAPLLSSDTPLTIATKPAIKITAEHRGVIPRPVVFKDTERGIDIHFRKNTRITKEDGKVFDGYILSPENLYMKNFPINFGYSFKLIFKFEAAENEPLRFDPPLQIVIPYSERFDERKTVIVFHYDPETEQYSELPKGDYGVDLDSKTVTIFSDHTDSFFLAQEGEGFLEAEFKDMNGHWARNYAEALYRKGVVKGRDKGIFAPDKLLNRAEFTKIALKAIGVDVEEDIEDSPFEDIPLYSWYAPYVKKAKELGMINGYPDGSFRPEKPIIRAEAIKILINAFEFDLKDYEDPATRQDPYRDLYPEQWYFPSVNFVIKNKLFHGLRKEGKILPDWFGPDQPITRGEMAKLAIKTMELAEEKELQ